MNDDADDYDEFGMLGDNAAEAGLALSAIPPVTRTSFTQAGGQTVSALAWGDVPPELVLLHGGGQNAHTWDTVALALGRPLLAVDLPGHGHSGRRQDRDYGPWRNAEAVAAVIGQAAPAARAVVGMSLGGATLIRLAATRPDLVRRAVIIDVTPDSGVRSRAMSQAERGAVALVSGPPGYDSFEAMAAAAVAASPGRPRSAVERGVRHNARRLPDGRWTWRYDLFGERPAPVADHTALWPDVSAITAPVMLVLGADSQFTGAEDVAEFRRRLPAARVEVVPGAGHAIQSDQPLALARLIEDFIL
ncbi:MAG TPA: alpha/beta hydrolase [Streptosporangiaceae bacterium]